MEAAIYKSLSGAVAQMRKLEIASQDLANLNTSGYKGQHLAFNEVLAPQISGGARSGGFVAVGEQRTNFAPGVLQGTGNPFHLAIDGEGYFVVATSRGERYTRSGGFTLSAEGNVITPQGEVLLGQGGAVQVSGGKFEVSSDGTVRSDSGEVGKIRVVRFIETRLVTKEGANLLMTDDNNVEDVEIARVAQGNLEQSNVNPVDSMVSLITIQRQFEAYERSMKLIDGATQKMIGDAGR